MVKKLSLVLACVFLFSAAPVMAQTSTTTTAAGPALRYGLDRLEAGNPGGLDFSLQTYDTTILLDVGDEVDIDLWVRDVPEPLITAGFLLTYDPAAISVVSLSAYATSPSVTPGPWDSAGTVILPDANGPGSYVVALVNFSLVPIGLGGDIIMAKLRIRCESPMHSLLQVVPIPGFDTVVGGISGTVYDPQMGPGSLALTIDVCEGDFDSDGDQDGTDAFVFKKDFGRGRFNRPCPYMETTTTTSMMITTTTIPSDYCPPYFTWCGSRCADTTTDENNCGSCGNVCQNGQMCVNGECEQLGSTCSGTLSPLGRWCDQGNGTVKDMSTGLIWLKDAGWGGAKYFVDTTNWDDAGTRAAILESGMAGLSDGSMWIAWRLPTLSELIGLTTGDEYIRSSSPYFFTNVQSDIYWATSTASFFMIPGWVRSGINLTDGSSYAGLGVDNNQLYVWPVRGGE